MKNYLPTIYLAALLTSLLFPSQVHGQSFVGGGVAFGGIVGNGNNGQSTQVGGFGEGTFSRDVDAIRLRIDLNNVLTYEYAPKAGTDGGTDLRIRPEFRIVASPFPVKPFAGFGAQYSRFYSRQYDKSGLNYVVTGGVITKRHTFRVSRLFTDRSNFNDNRMEGWRYGYDLLQRIPSSTWALRLSLEYNRFSYVQPFGPTAGRYNDQSIAVRVGIVRKFCHL